MSTGSRCMEGFRNYTVKRGSPAKPGGGENKKADPREEGRHNVYGCSHSRRLAVSTCEASSSMPMYRRPKIFAAKSVLPEPQNASRTISPGSVNAWMTGLSEGTGFCVGCKR